MSMTDIVVTHSSVTTAKKNLIEFIFSNGFIYFGSTKMRMYEMGLQHETTIAIASTICSWWSDVFNLWILKSFNHVLICLA